MPILKKIIVAAIVLYGVSIVIQISRSQAYQQDFRTYYFAAMAQRAGLNPYSLSEVSRATGTPPSVPFLYPPGTLAFFHVFTLFSYPAAFQIFLYAKAVLLVGLLLLWTKGFLGNESDAGFAVFCLFAFNGAIYIDFRAGNISILEQSLLWSGFYFFLLRRWAIFSLFILAAASFKITPIVFLLLLAFTGDRRKYHYLAGGLGVFLGIHAVTYLWNPGLFSAFIQSLGQVKEGGGITNPSLFALIGDALAVISRHADVLAIRVLQWFLYGVAAAGVAFLFWRGVVRSGNENDPDRNRMMIFFSCLTYALAAVRFKDYSYVLLLVPAYVIIRRTSYRDVYSLLFILLIFSTGSHSLLPWPRFWSYYPLFLAAGVFALYAREFLPYAPGLRE
jgi:hypothetical protein